MSLLEDMLLPFQSITTDACSQLASTQLGPVDSDIADVEDNWRTTGFYTLDQWTSINSFAAQVLSRAQNALGEATSQLQTDAHRVLLDAASDSLQGPSNDLTKFENAMTQARQQGIDVIEAPGFKRFIIAVLKASRAARLATSTVACARPNVLFGALQALDSAREALVAAVKAVVAVAVQVGQLVLKIPDLLTSFFSFLKVFPWIVLGVGGYYVAVKTEAIPPKYDPLKLRDRETWKPWRKKA